MQKSTQNQLIKFNKIIQHAKASTEIQVKEEENANSESEEVRTRSFQPPKQIKEINKVKATKKIKKQNTCGHVDQEHYAKNLCYTCYHKFGRNKKPWKCSHDVLYARGLCQLCYVELYNRKRKRMGFRKKKYIPKSRIPSSSDDLAIQNSMQNESLSTTSNENEAISDQNSN